MGTKLPTDSIAVENGSHEALTSKLPQSLFITLKGLPPTATFTTCKKLPDQPNDTSRTAPDGRLSTVNKTASVREVPSKSHVTNLILVPLGLEHLSSFTRFLVNFKNTDPNGFPLRFPDVSEKEAIALAQFMIYATQSPRFKLFKITLDGSDAIKGEVDLFKLNPVEMNALKQKIHNSERDLVDWDTTTAELSLAISTDARGKGLAKYAICEGMKIAKTLGYQQLHLSIYRGNEKMLNCIQKMVDKSVIPKEAAQIFLNRTMTYHYVFIDLDKIDPDKFPAQQATPSKNTWRQV